MSNTTLSTTEILSYLNLASVENHMPLVGLTNFYNGAYQQALADAQIAISLVVNGLNMTDEYKYTQYSLLVFPKVLQTIEMLKIVSNIENKYKPLFKQLDPQIQTIIDSDEFKEAIDEKAQSKLLSPITHSKAYSDLFALNSEFIKTQTDIAVQYKDLHSELATLSQLNNHNSDNDIDAVKKGAVVIYDGFYVYAGDKNISSSTTVNNIKDLNKIELKDIVSLFADKDATLHSKYGNVQLNQLNITLGALKTILENKITMDKHTIASLYGLLKSVPADQSNIDNDFRVQDQIKIDSSIQALKAPIERASFEILPINDKTAHTLEFSNASLAEGTIKFGKDKAISVKDGLINKPAAQIEDFLPRALAALSKNSKEANKIYYFEISDKEENANEAAAPEANAAVANAAAANAGAPEANAHKLEKEAQNKQYAIYYTGSQKDTYDDVLIKLPATSLFNIKTDAKSSKTTITFVSADEKADEDNNAPKAPEGNAAGTEPKQASVTLDNKSVFDKASGAKTDETIKQHLRINALEFTDLKPGHHTLSFKNAKLGKATLDNVTITNGKIATLKDPEAALKLLKDLGAKAAANELYYAKDELNPNDKAGYKFYYTGTEKGIQDDVLITITGINQELDLKGANVTFDVQPAQ